MALVELGGPVQAHRGPGRRQGPPDGGPAQRAGGGLQRLGGRRVPPDHQVGVGAQRRDVVEAAQRDALLGQFGDQVDQFGGGLVGGRVQVAGPGVHRERGVDDLRVDLPRGRACRGGPARSGGRSTRRRWSGVGVRCVTASILPHPAAGSGGHRSLTARDTCHRPTVHPVAGRDAAPQTATSAGLHRRASPTTPASPLPATAAPTTASSEPGASSARRAGPPRRGRAGARAARTASGPPRVDDVRRGAAARRAVRRRRPARSPADRVRPGRSSSPRP